MEMQPSAQLKLFLRNDQGRKVMQNSKKISVLMGIYNCAETLEQAVESIQNQTYENWELILCDDGSTDSTYDVARKLADSDERIVLRKNDNNYGLNKTLNRCLAYATGEYIARMDGDDISLPTRFQKEIFFLEGQDVYDIVSTPMIFFDESGEWGRNYKKEFPQPEDLIAGSPICHAPVMMRKFCLDKVGGYTEDKHMLRVEDVNLWIKLYSEGYRCCNLQEPLYKMRNDKNALNRRKYKYRINSTYVRLQGCRLLGLAPIDYVKSLKPMVHGLVPANVRYLIKKGRINS
jgi:glycosyltransferase EpsE